MSSPDVSSLLSSSVECLASDVLLMAFSFLEMRELITCSQVSREFCKYAMDDILWKGLAYRRFGKPLTESTLARYQGNYRPLMADDNRKGALPTLLHLQPSHWTENYHHPNHRPGNFCCRLPCIKWDRVSKMLNVYVDVVGDSKLRSPFNSRIQRRRHLPTDKTNNLVTVLGQEEEQDERISISAISFVIYKLFREPHQEGLRHHCQGRLQFPQHQFTEPGTYSFCYSNRNSDSLLSDAVLEIPILTVEEGEKGLTTAAFERGVRGDSRKLYFTDHSFPLEVKHESVFQTTSHDEDDELPQPQIKWFYSTTA